MFSKKIQITIIYGFIIAQYLICSTNQLKQLNNYRLTAKILSTQNQPINQSEIKRFSGLNKSDHYLRKSLNSSIFDSNSLTNKKINISSNKHLDDCGVNDDRQNTFHKQTINYVLNRLRKRRNEISIRNVSNNFNELLNNLSNNQIKVTKSLNSDLDKSNNIIIKEYEGLY